MITKNSLYFSAICFTISVGILFLDIPPLFFMISIIGAVFSGCFINDYFRDTDFAINIKKIKKDKLFVVVKIIDRDLVFISDYSLNNKNKILVKGLPYLAQDKELVEEGVYSIKENIRKPLNLELVRFFP